MDGEVQSNSISGHCIREHLQIELFTLNVIMTLRGEGGLGVTLRKWNEAYNIVSF